MERCVGRKNGAARCRQPRLAMLDADLWTLPAAAFSGDFRRPSSHTFFVVLADDSGKVITTVAIVSVPVE